MAFKRGRRGGVFNRLAGVEWAWRGSLGGSGSVTQGEGEWAGWAGEGYRDMP